MNGQKNEYNSFSKTFCESRLVKVAIVLIIILITLIALVLFFEKETNFFFFSMLSFSVASVIFLSIAVYYAAYTVISSQNREKEKRQNGVGGAHKPDENDMCMAKVYAEQAHAYYESARDMNVSMQGNHNTAIAYLAVLAAIIGLSVSFAVGTALDQAKVFNDGLEKSTKLLDSHMETTSLTIKEQEEKLSATGKKSTELQERVERISNEANTVDKILSAYKYIQDMHLLRENILLKKASPLEFQTITEEDKNHILDIFVLQAYATHRSSDWDKALFWWEQVEQRYPQKNTVLSYLAEALHGKALQEEDPVKKKKLLRKAYEKHKKSLELYPDVNCLEAYEKTIAMMISLLNEGNNDKRDFIKDMCDALKLFSENGEKTIEKRKEKSSEDAEGLNKEFEKFRAKCTEIIGAYSTDTPETTNE